MSFTPLQALRSELGSSASSDPSRQLHRQGRCGRWLRSQVHLGLWDRLGLRRCSCGWDRPGLQSCGRGSLMLWGCGLGRSCSRKCLPPLGLRSPCWAATAGRSVAWSSTFGPIRPLTLLCSRTKRQDWVLRQPTLLCWGSWDGYWFRHRHWFCGRFRRMALQLTGECNRAL